MPSESLTSSPVTDKQNSLHLGDHPISSLEKQQQQPSSSSDPTPRLSRKVFRAERKKQRRKEARQAAAKERLAVRRKTKPSEETAAIRQRIQQQQEEYLKAKQLWERRETQAEQAIQRRKAKEKEQQSRSELSTVEQATASSSTDMANTTEPMEPQAALQQQEDVVMVKVGSEADQVHCSFYLKTGACRYGPTCSRAHLYPPISTAICLKNMFQPPSFQTSEDDALEFDETEMQKLFREFVEDVYPELERFGTIKAFKVSCNHAQHLRGNVYVVYEDEAHAMLALTALNGRFYAKRPIVGEFSPVTDWKSAGVCGLFDKGRCDRGNQCNFLHLFRNPRDIVKCEQVSRSRSKSPSRHERPRRRSSSRDRGSSRRDRDRDRDRRRRSRSRSRSRSRHRSRSRSRSRDRYHRSRHDRSRSRDRHRRSHDRSRSRSRDRRTGSSKSDRQSDLRDRTEPEIQKQAALETQQ